MRIEAAFVAMLSLFASMTFFGGTGECMGKHGETFVLKGTVGVVGNEPFARLVLTVPPPGGSGRPADHVVKGPLAAELRSRHQGKTVTVECRPCGEDARDRLPCVEPVRIVEVE